MSISRNKAQHHLSYRGVADGGAEQSCSHGVFSPVIRRTIGWQLLWLSIFGIGFGAVILLLVGFTLTSQPENAIVCIVAALMFGVLIIGTIDEIMAIHDAALRDTAYYYHQLNRLTETRAARMEAGETTGANGLRAPVVVPHNGSINHGE